MSLMVNVNIIYLCQCLLGRSKNRKKLSLFQFCFSFFNSVSILFSAFSSVRRSFHWSNIVCSMSKCNFICNWWYKYGMCVTFPVDQVIFKHISHFLKKSLTENFIFCAVKLPSTISAF